MTEMNQVPASSSDQEVLGNQPSAAARAASDSDSEKTAVSMVSMVRNVRAAFDTAYTSAETAEGLVAVAPKVGAVAYGLIAFGMILMHLLPAGFIWGLFSMLSAMMSGFFWLCSSTAMKLHEVTKQTRADLQRAMLLEASAFIVAMLSLVYLFGKGFKLL